jgi:hypothetical protein
MMIRSEESQTYSNAQTAAAIISGFLLVIPFGFLSGIAVIAYRFLDRFGAHIFGDYVYIPFASELMIIITQYAIPSIIRGATTGYLTIMVTYALFKRANKNTVVVGVLSAWTPVFVAVIIFHTYAHGFDLDLLDFIISPFSFFAAAMSTHNSNAAKPF